eukprot:TRINITY_DN23910_c0_g2_i1.p1 TRINITY_DN23910_c0_g2~~TRINITY_DN23910_c0_g2_i1.p1  ORF type:complete len:456 (-),score=31.34 TRINITY_DN23910_c0_g2_i1:206-1573(-)
MDDAGTMALNNKTKQTRRRHPAMCVHMLWFFSCSEVAIETLTMFTLLSRPIPLHGVGECRLLVACSLNTSTRWFNSQRLAAYSFGHMDRRRQRLKAFLRKLHLPPITHVTAFGKAHKLPVRVCGNRVDDTIESQRFEYFGGFFDGDGCVSTEGGVTCVLSVGQSVNQAEILFLFLRTFGGIIYRLANEKGAVQASVRWVIRGSAGGRVAHLLAASSRLKREQLRIAADWPRCPVERAVQISKLKLLKRTSHVSSCIPSWPYLAGLFDAEGCIRILPVSKAVQLEIGQNSVALLEAVDAFLASEVPGYVGNIYKNGKTNHKLVIWRLRPCVHILRRLVSAGMFVKKPHAFVVFRLLESGHADLRASLHALVGNQGRYRRLDEAGCGRAREIQRTRDAIKRRLAAARYECARLLQQRLEDLQAEHMLRSAESTYLALRRDIRALISRGASLSDEIRF